MNVPFSESKVLIFMENIHSVKLIHFISRVFWPGLFFQFSGPQWNNTGYIGSCINPIFYHPFTENIIPNTNWNNWELIHWVKLFKLVIVLTPVVLWRICWTRWHRRLTVWHSSTCWNVLLINGNCWWDPHPFPGLWRNCANWHWDGHQWRRCRRHALLWIICWMRMILPMLIMNKRFLILNSPDWMIPQVHQVCHCLL